MLSTRNYPYSLIRFQRKRILNYSFIQIRIRILSAITAFGKVISNSAFAEADVIVEQEYRTPAQEHAYLQPEAGLGYIDEEGRVTVVVAGQWTHADQEQIAHALDLPLDQVRVIYPAIGGAFGGREDMSGANRTGISRLAFEAKGN